MTALVTVDFVTARPGFAGVDEGELQAVIDDASALVALACSPNLDGFDDTTCPPAVAAVLVNMVRRGVGNPKGAQSETLGDYSYAMASEGGVPTIYLTRRELKIVRRATGTLGVLPLSIVGYLPVQRSGLVPLTPSGGGTDPWDAVTIGTD